MKLSDIDSVLLPETRVSLHYNKILRSGESIDHELIRGTWWSVRDAIASLDTSGTRPEKVKYLNTADVLSLEPVQLVNGLHLRIQLEDYTER